MTAPRDTPGEYDRLLFHRAVLLWLHIVCAIAIGLVFLSIHDFSHLAYWSRGGGMAVLMTVAFPMLPYWISRYQSRRRVNYHRAGFWIFCMIVLFGTCVVGYLYLFEPNQHAGLAAVGLPFAQIVIYLYMIGTCLGNDTMPKP
jgi:hypothetical protein